ncbi:MAG: 4-hydroxy-tetrahydrodipicolinate synthase [Clostridia bacterium]|nr:4-hydroxy-tetrahydrodipicolinate synthase [Clostridia bacterium]
MDRNNNINYETLEKLIEFQINNSTDAIISCGTTGESSVLSSEERQKIIEFTIKKVNHRVPVIVGTGSNNTQTALEFSKQAEKLGADGLLIVTPYYNKCSQESLVSHYNYIADRVSTPIILYNVPSRTGVNIHPETYLKLSEHSNICATKEASGNLSNILKTKYLCGDNLDIYSGNDDQIVPVLSLGGIGVISVLANVCPKETHDIIYNYLNNNISISRDLQIRYTELIELLFSDVNPVPVKKALNLMGFDCGSCRLPLGELNSANTQKLQDSLQKLNLV